MQTWQNKYINGHGNIISIQYHNGHILVDVPLNTLTADG